VLVENARTVARGADGKRKILVIYGTRPEAIKLAPVISAIRASSVVSVVVAVTGQHREMLDQVNALFSISPDHDLDIFRHGQSLADITARSLTGLSGLMQKLRPDAVVVQGDTTSTFAAALAAFYERIPAVHVEAGLRTGNMAEPFPEEANRRLTSRLTALHLAPTASARNNLLADGVDGGDIVVTGNTVVDALLDVVRRRLPYTTDGLAEVENDSRRVILVTAHRRETWGAPMVGLGQALAELAKRPDVLLVVPVHPNPAVRADLLPPLLGLPNVRIMDPLPYGDFSRLLRRADLAISDSGGIQEEAPSVGTPVLVLRSLTERMEAVDAGSALLVGTQPANVLAAARRLLDNDLEYQAMVRVQNPFGDGHAAARVVSAIDALLGVGARVGDFTAA
jgi:UDP-N-acetylglucosamine 2-epimerase (non-hydrolysing)